MHRVLLPFWPPLPEQEPGGPPRELVALARAIARGLARQHNEEDEAAECDEDEAVGDVE